MPALPFVERRFGLEGNELVVRFFKPVRDPKLSFYCRYVIKWPGEQVSRRIYGQDGVQALMLAMRTVHTLLIESDAYKAGRLTWCDQADLDLPPTWGVGPLYDTPSQK